MNHRLGSTAIHVTSALALALGMVTATQASPVTVTGTFTSFSTWMFDPSVRQSLVNGSALTSSGTVVGSNGAIDYYESNTLNFAVPTTSLDFSYGQAGFDPPFPWPTASGLRAAAPTSLPARTSRSAPSASPMDSGIRKPMSAFS